jgi:hypothetical protein
VVRRRRTRGGALAPNSDDASTIEGRRRRTRSVWCFTEVWAPFYRVGTGGEADSEGLQWPVVDCGFNATGYRGEEVG